MEYIRYKGKGEHSVNELEKIIEQREEQLHLLNSNQKETEIAELKKENERLQTLADAGEPFFIAHNQDLENKISSLTTLCNEKQQMIERYKIFIENIVSQRNYSGAKEHITPEFFDEAEQLLSSNVSEEKTSNEAVFNEKCPKCGKWCKGRSCHECQYYW